MDSHWHKIISFNGSQSNAFEELICQLARHEINTEFQSYERVGTPDGGMECYWMLVDGTEWGWQVKYYQNLGPGEWSSIKQSLFKAFETHPQMSRYHICLPHNLSDARNGKKTQKAYWDKYKEKWESELKAKGAEIELILWSSSIIINKLTQSINQGINTFFFDDIHLDETKLFHDLDISIANLGPRYSPELNLTQKKYLNYFDALTRTQAFYLAFIDVFNPFRETFEKTDRQPRLYGNKNGEIRKYELLYDSICRIVDNISYSQAFSEAIEALREKVNQMSVLTEIFMNQSPGPYREPTKFITPLSEQSDHPAPGTFRASAHKIQNHLKSIEEYLNNPLIKVAEKGILFITGAPGTGKSHLIAGIANQKKEQGIPSILILGTEFPAQSPLQTLENRFGNKTNLAHYLNALESIGRSKNERILFMIDAINEGEGRYSWQSNLQGIVQYFSIFKWIAFVLSYRSTFKEIIIPENFKAPTLVHEGFAGQEYDATKSFFMYYGIQQPSIPILNPEFSNPLFLKTFCHTLNILGKRTIPAGYEGITQILKEYLTAINKSIGTRIKYAHTKLNLVEKAIQHLLAYQIELNSTTLPYEGAYQRIEPILQQYSNHRGFIDELIQEGLLIEDHQQIGKSAPDNDHNINFNYERFNEHFKALYLLDGIRNVSDLRKSFKPGGKVGSIILNNIGLLNAFSIIIPEKFGIELHEILASYQRYQGHVLYSSFLQSLVWRKQDSIKLKSYAYAKLYTKNNTDHLKHFLTAIIPLASNPESVYNANFIDTELTRYKLAELDRNWSIPVLALYQKDSTNVIERTIRWASIRDEKNETTEASIYLMAKLLVWFFTSPNENLRNTSRYAFSTLLANRLTIALAILKDFKNTIDPYILESLVIGIFEALKKSSDPQNAYLLATYIYEQYFRSKELLLNVSTRESLKCIIQFVNSQNNENKIHNDEITPPFQRTIYNPTVIKLFKKITDPTRSGSGYKKNEQSFELGRSLDSYFSSLRVFGKSHYTETPFENYSFNSKKAFETLGLTLTGNKLKFFNNLVNEISQLPRYKPNNSNHSETSISKRKPVQIPTELNKILLPGVKLFSNTELDQIKTSIEYILYCLNEEYGYKKFPIEKIKEYVSQRIYSLGWSEELSRQYYHEKGYGRAFANDDSMVKKYINISMHEVLALITDNYQYAPRNTYSHTLWPSTLHTLMERLARSGNHYSDSNKIISRYNSTSLKVNRNLETQATVPDWPNMLLEETFYKNKLVFIDPSGISWYLLFTHYTHDFRKTKKALQHSYNGDVPWVSISSYLIPKTDKAKFLKEKTMKNYDIITIHFQNHLDTFSHIEDWTIEKAYEIYDHKKNKSRPLEDIINYEVGKRIIPTVTHDNHLTTRNDKIINPCKVSNSFLKLLRPNEPFDSPILDEYNDQIVIDASTYPSHFENGLLIKKDELDACLKKENLTIVWGIVSGQLKAKNNSKKFLAFCGFHNKNLIINPERIEP